MRHGYFQLFYIVNLPAPWAGASLSQLKYIQLRRRLFLGFVILYVLFKGQQ